MDKFQKEQGSGPVTKDMGTENDDHDPAQTYAFTVNPNASVEKGQAWREGRPARATVAENNEGQESGT